jgi:hypothetical protein
MIVINRTNNFSKKKKKRSAQHWYLPHLPIRGENSKKPVLVYIIVFKKCSQKPPKKTKYLPV